MSFSFSTSWTDNSIERLHSVLPFIDAIEASSRGDSSYFMQIQEMALDGRLRASSVHAVAGPHKTETDVSYTRHFASFDTPLQEKDIEDVLLTAEWSLTLGSKAVVIHAGRIADEKLRNLYLLYKNKVIHHGLTPELEDMRSELITMRARYRDHIDPVTHALERLLKAFPDVLFCFETRLHYYEIPLPDEADELFKRLPYPNLGYWHDIGHTYTLDRLGLVPMTEWQQRFKERCIGVHIHDIDHLLNDHYPPGFGSLDLKPVLRQFHSDTLFTLEINRRHTEDEVIQGIESLKSDLVLI
ncbi:MAG: sugar phosphate isomerase/epimerase [Spirochaetota bacterium]|nr:MAG: sugar phosphate isomerase/epimerase [Spirochaetota bacterium]